VVIRYNRIIRCGSGAGSQDGACGITVKVEAPNEKVAGLHKRLLIEGNIIEGENSNRGISISGADDVTVRNNEISGCKTPVHVQYSTNVKVYNNRQVPAEESK
jgi:parallel beta-helix repeat protein